MLSQCIAQSSGQALSVLIIGANGYLGSAVGRAFNRSPGPQPYFFRVYGLVRRESTAATLAANEIIPIVGDLSQTETLGQSIILQSPTWDVIAVCTEPSKLDADAEEAHWRSILSLVQALARSSASAQPSKRPFVIWSSGCKDYGITLRHDDVNLQPHTEHSDLVPHPLVRGRMKGALDAVAAALDQGQAQETAFDVAIIRPTPVYGYSSSYYGAMFDYLDAYTRNINKLTSTDRRLKLKHDAGTIIHGLHIDDCGDAYVSLAKTAIFGKHAPTTTGGNDTTRASSSSRSHVANQAFNISGRSYETLAQVAAGLAAEYGLEGVEFNVPASELPDAVRNENVDLVFGYSQWVASDKIRSVTGWSDQRPLFHQNIGVYRRAYHAARDAGCDNIAKTRQRVNGYWGDL